MDLNVKYVSRQWIGLYVDSYQAIDKKKAKGVKKMSRNKENPMDKVIHGVSWGKNKDYFLFHHHTDHHLACMSI
jgi:hypothetical protein